MSFDHFRLIIGSRIGKRAGFGSVEEKEISWVQENQENDLLRLKCGEFLQTATPSYSFE